MTWFSASHVCKLPHHLICSKDTGEQHSGEQDGTRQQDSGEQDDTVEQQDTPEQHTRDILCNILQDLARQVMPCAKTVAHHLCKTAAHHLSTLGSYSSLAPSVMSAIHHSHTNTTPTLLVSFFVYPQGWGRWNCSTS